MAKSNNERRVAANQAMAVCNSLRTSPRKLNLVAQSIRGLHVEKAVAELSFSKKRIAKAALAVLQSAIANAENNHQLNIDKLYVSEAYVGKGLVMKRMHARGRGRGAKVNPTGLRLGVNRTWDSRWYADDKFTDYLHEDLKIKEFLKKKLAQAGISRIVIERPAKKARVTIHSARPGVVIGKKGQDIELLRKEIQKMTDSEVQLNILEVRKPELDAQLVADSVAQQLERRVAFRRAMKRVMQSALRLGAEGIKVSCSGRLGGAEIARTEYYREGRVPLHTLRADIDYATSTAHTTYGACGVKVWIYKGEIMAHDPMAQDKKLAEQK